MGNVNMEARQVHFRGGDKPMSVEEAIKEAGVLPIASAEVLGGVKVGEGLEIDSETGVLSAGEYELPIAGHDTLGGIMTGDGLFTDPETGETEVNIKENGGLMFDQDGKLYAQVDYAVNNFNENGQNQTRIGNYISGSDVYPVYRRCFSLNQSIAADTTGVNIVNINNYSINGAHVMRVVLRSAAGDVTSSFIYDCSGYFLAIRKNLAGTAITITQAIVEYY